MITNESGIGGLTAFCATVASTAGLAGGQSITIAGEHSNLEVARIVSVVDATHLTLNAQMYHDTGETLAAGGAQGYGISFLADDIAPGKLLNYYTQPQVTLHKFFPIVASDSTGALLVYTNSAQSYEVSSVGYMANQPNLPATVLSVAMRGTGVSAIVLRNPDQADYNARPPRRLGRARPPLRPRSHLLGPCTTLPAASASYPYPGNGGHTGISIAITNSGVCSAPPKVTLQTTWPTRTASLHSSSPQGH